LSTHLRVGLPSGVFPSGFPTDILYRFLFSPCVLHALHSNCTWRGVQVMNLLITQFSPTSCHFLSLFGPNILLRTLFSFLSAWVQFGRHYWCSVIY
jgi:hypothetical protein